MAAKPMGYTAYVTGLAQAPRGLGMLIGTPLVGVFDRQSERPHSGWPRHGPDCESASLMMGNFSLDISSHEFFWPNFIQGFGMALTMVPLVTVAMATIRNEQMGNATGLSRSRATWPAASASPCPSRWFRVARCGIKLISATHLTPYDLPYHTAVQTGQAVTDSRNGRRASGTRTRWA